MRGCWLLLCAIAFAACSNPAIGVDTEGLDTEDTMSGTYRFSLYVTLGGADGSTRATNELQTAAEKEINTITVFFTDINADGTESNVSYEQTFSLQNLIPRSDGSYLLSFRAHVVAGKKKIYIGANLRSEQIAAFKNSTDCTYSCGTLIGTQQPVQKVMDIDSNGNGSNIVMFAATGQEITIDPNPEADHIYQLTEPYQLERIVSKVLLLFSNLDECTTEGDNHTHIKVKLYSDTEDGTQYGWAPLSDVRYFLNTTNKKLYLMPQTKTVNGVTYDIDPNWEVSTFLSAVQGQNDLRMTNATAFAQNFKYYEATAMLPEWRDNTTQTDVYYFNEMLRATPEVYSKDKLDNNEYKTGLYCIENLVYNNTGVADIDQSANLVSTYMVVAIRFVPRNICDVIENEDGTATLQETHYEHHANAYAALQNQVDAQGNKIFPGTYWVLSTDNTLSFYTYKGMQQKIAESDGTLTEESFIKHSAGLSYYTTYIDPKEETTTEAVTISSTDATTISYSDRTRWGLRRNYHYTLVVESLNGLGASEPGTSPIKVRSVRALNWNNRGSRTVSVQVTPTK